MARTAILTTAVGYQPEHMQFLWRSLQRCKFDGTLVMLTDGKTADALEPAAPSFTQFLVYEPYTPQILLPEAPPEIQQMALAGVPLDSEEFFSKAAAIDSMWTDHFFVSFNHPSVFRYLFYRDYLQKNGDRFDAVVLCDGRDVLFQRSPGDVLNAQTPLSFGLEVQRCVLGAEPFNTGWVTHLWGAEIFEAYKGRRIVCSGATVGNTKAIQNYLDLMRDYLLRHADRTRHAYGFDQAFHNRMWWDGQLPDLLMTENFLSDVANVQGEPDARLLELVKDGQLCRADNGQPIMLVHQYDRYADLTAKITAGW